MSHSIVWNSGTPDYGKVLTVGGENFELKGIQKKEDLVVYSMMHQESERKEEQEQEKKGRGLENDCNQISSWTTTHFNAHSRQHMQELGYDSKRIEQDEQRQRL